MITLLFHLCTAIATKTGLTTDSSNLFFVDSLQTGEPELPDKEEYSKVLP